MSTSCLIGIELGDGSIHAIHCHWDGDIYHTGFMLRDFYNSMEKVQELINLGDVSYIAERVKPNEGDPHSFTKPANGVTVAYHRDRGERYNEPSFFFSRKLYSGRKHDERRYLFDGVKWLVKRGRDFIPIPDK